MQLGVDVELRLKNVSKVYENDGKQMPTVDDVNLKISKRESVAILGPSGCGKTTLIRMIAGLEMPTSGSIYFHGRPLTEPDRHIMMVFQSFALLPWKTVYDNIELALLDKPNSDRKAIVDKYIHLIGLEGFSETYPRDLSGGMKQRVGIARALCREPDILILDDAFSGLDQLTSRNLQNEILRYYKDRRTKPDVLLLITHNIQEAVYMADRVIVLSSRPGHIVADMKIDLEKPKNMRDKRFQDYVDEITSLIT